MVSGFSAVRRGLSGGRSMGDWAFGAKRVNDCDCYSGNAITRWSTAIAEMPENFTYRCEKTLHVVLIYVSGAGHFGHKTLRHHKIGAEVSGHSGVGSEALAQKCLVPCMRFWFGAAPKCLVTEVSGSHCVGSDA